MSRLNNVKDEMVSLFGSIAIDAKARALLLMLRSDGVPLADCVKIAKQIKSIVEGYPDWKCESSAPATKLSEEMKDYMNDLIRSQTNIVQFPIPPIGPKEPA